MIIWCGVEICFLYLSKISLLLRKTVFCHMIQYITVCVAIAVLKMVKELELGYLFRYCMSCKNTSTLLPGSVLTPQQIIQECII